MAECKTQGLTGTGKFQSFKDHPEFLPAFPTFPKNRKLMEAITSGELKGLETIACLRFGGECNSGNLECKKMRGV
jgi:hypothetical protein